MYVFMMYHFMSLSFNFASQIAIVFLVSSLPQMYRMDIKTFFLECQNASIKFQGKKDKKGERKMFVPIPWTCTCLKYTTNMKSTNSACVRRMALRNIFPCVLLFFTPKWLWVVTVVSALRKMSWPSQSCLCLIHFIATRTCTIAPC